MVTQWSMVLAARDGDSTMARNALEQLCSLYWSPIYTFLRREGYRSADAEDLTQGFFAHILEQEFLTHLNHRNGRFRSFLLKFLQHYLSDQRDRNDALKRGGGKVIISLDQMAAEERMQFEPTDGMTAEQAYERRWFEAITTRALERLRLEYVERGRKTLYEQIKDLQPGKRGARNYAALGAQLGLSEQALKNAVHRLRHRHTQILREEIAQTVKDPSELKEEIRHLLKLHHR